MDKKRPLPIIVVFAVLTVITTFVWVGFEVYRTITKDPAPSVPEEIIAELDPNLDTVALARITQGVFLTDNEIEDTVLINIETFQSNINAPEETPIAEPVDEESALPDEELSDETVVEEATDEGEIAQ
jgi:hypothetical protein